MKLVILLILTFCLVILSAFFSGSETGVYRLSRLRLRLGVEKGHGLYKILGKIIKEGQGIIFSILIGNNLATYFATTFTTIIIVEYAGKPDTAEYYSTLIMAPLLFVCGEVVPKSIYYHKADHLMPRFAPILLFFHKLFSYTGLVKFLKILASGLTKILNIAEFEDTSSNAIVRQHIEGILQDTSNEGYLSHIQTDIVKRVMNIFDVKITSVMVPFSKVVAIDSNASKNDLLKLLASCPYTRILVYETEKENIIGFINIYEAIRNSEKEPLIKSVRPIYRFTSSTPVMRALNKMHEDPNIKIALIANARKNKKYQPLGIVTLKDLAEEITGELAAC